MTNIEQKRAFVGEMYPGKGWKAKVRKMSDEMVFAIYMREQHRLNNHPTKESKPESESEDDGIPF